MDSLPNALLKEKPCKIVLFVVEWSITENRIRTSMLKCCYGASGIEVGIPLFVPTCFHL
jgi:hypothetical protein